MVLLTVGVQTLNSSFEAVGLIDVCSDSSLATDDVFSHWKIIELENHFLLCELVHLCDWVIKMQHQGWLVLGDPLIEQSDHGVGLGVVWLDDEHHGVRGRGLEGHQGVVLVPKQLSCLVDVVNMSVGGIYNVFSLLH